MTLYWVLAGASLAIASIGLGMQSIYLLNAHRDYVAARDSGSEIAIQFFALSRIISSASLGVVHLVVVASLALIRQDGAPDVTAFELVALRGTVSTLVVISTSINFMARTLAIRHAGGSLSR